MKNNENNLKIKEKELNINKNTQKNKNQNEDYIDVEFKEINENENSKQNKNKKFKTKIVKEKGYKRAKLKSTLENIESNYNYYKSLPKGFRKFVNYTIIISIVGGTMLFTVKKLENENAKLTQQNQILAAQQDEIENARILAEQEMLNKFEEIKSNNIEVTIEHKSTVSEKDNKENKPLEYIYTKTFENNLLWLFDTEITLPYKANLEYEIKADLSKFEYNKFDFENKKLKLGISEDNIYLVNYDTTKENPIYVRMIGDPIKIAEEELKSRGIKEGNLAAKINSSDEKEMLKEYRSKFEKHYSQHLLNELNREEEKQRLKNVIIKKIQSVYEIIGLDVEVEILKIEK